MSVVWQCDRCHVVSDRGFPPDDLPEDWRKTDRLVLGSEGARSLMEAVLCDECDVDAYHWWQGDDHYLDGWLQARAVPAETEGRTDG